MEITRMGMVGNGITMYGTTWCGDCHRARRFLDQDRVPYGWVDIDQDPRAQELVLRMNGGLRVVPTIVFPDGSTLVEPSIRELKAKVEQFPELRDGGRGQ